MKLPREKKYRRKFRGIRTDTATVGLEIIDGFVYRKRSDGSLYPKHTTIPVTETTRGIYAILREAGNYDNYDELLLDIALPIVRNKSLPVFKIPGKSLALEEATVQRLKCVIEQATVEKSWRASARKKAILKRRYLRRHTSEYQ